MLYKVTLWTPLKHEPGWENIGLTHIVGTEKAAKALASNWLAPYKRYETWYSRRNRTAFVELKKVVKGAVVEKFTIEPVTVIVPSVGELGWTP